jgi:hypothetical protein
MKYFFLLLLTAITLIGCSKDDKQSQDPLSQLPPATQIGANTFGCLLDGEAFIPRGGQNPLDCQYQLINGERYFQLQGRNRNENFNLISIAISTKAKAIEQGETYQLIEEAEGNVNGRYGFSGTFSFTNSIQTGQMTITYLDMDNQIVSGTFWFDVIDQNGDLRQIREGRFDMQFTQ